MLNLFIGFIFGIILTSFLFHLVIKRIIFNMKTEFESSLKQKTEEADTYFTKFIDISKHTKIITHYLVEATDYLPRGKREKSIKALLEFDDYIKNQKETLNIN